MELLSVHDPGYRVRPVTTFGQFTERWEEAVLVRDSLPRHYSPARQKVSGPFFGNLQLRDVRSGENVQRFIAAVGAGPKTVRNIFVTLLSKSAHSWRYISNDALDDVVLPTPRKAHAFRCANALLMATESYPTAAWTQRPPVSPYTHTAWRVPMMSDCRVVGRIFRCSWPEDANEADIKKKACLCLASPCESSRIAGCGGWI